MRISRIKLFSSSNTQQPQKKNDKVGNSLLGVGAVGAVGGTGLALGTRSKAKIGREAIKDAEWEANDLKKRLKWLGKEKRNIQNSSKILNDKQLNDIYDTSKKYINETTEELKNNKSVRGFINEAIGKGKEAIEKNIPKDGVIGDTIKAGKEAIHRNTPEAMSILSRLNNARRYFQGVAEGKVEKIKKNLKERLPKIEQEIAEKTPELEKKMEKAKAVAQEHSGIIRKNKAGKIIAATGIGLTAAGVGKKLHDKKKQKSYSDSDEETKKQGGFKDDSKKMINAGKVGLGIGAGIGVASAYHAGQGIRHIGQGISDLKGKGGSSSKKLLREVINDTIDRHAPFSSGDAIKAGIDDLMEVKGKMGKSTVGKIELGSKVAKMATKLPRWVTNNAHLLVDKGVTEFKERNRGRLSKEDLKTLDKFAPATKKIGKGATFLRNSKFLGKIGAGVAAGGGALYVNGRMMKSSDRGARATEEGNKINSANRK